MIKLAFVDSIAATPTVLLDLAGEFRVRPTSSFAPPRVRRALSSTALVDGSHEADATYDDREVVLDMALGDDVASADQLDRVQRLARLVSSPQWLMVQLPGAPSPVFLRTKRADTSVIDVILTEWPNRQLTLKLPADPFAYGLPESATTTIENNPIVGTNRMCMVFDPIKGDVPAPLVMAFPTPARRPGTGLPREAKYRSVVTSWAPGQVDPQPLFATASQFSFSGALLTVSPAPDSNFATGNRYRIAPTSINAFGYIEFSLAVPSAEDYRIFARGRASGPEMTLRLQLGQLMTSEPTRVRRPSLVGLEWFDLGVVRLPNASVDTDDPFDLSPSVAPAPLALELQFLQSTSQYFDLDCLIAVPVGHTATHATQSTFRMSSPDFATDTLLTLDGINDRRYASWATTGGNVQRHQHVADIAGGLPMLSPTRRTQVGLIPVVALEPGVSAGGAIADSITSTADVAWKYFPRYLYMRGSM